MRIILATIIVAASFSGCSSASSNRAAPPIATIESGGSNLTEDQKHKLYTAALAVSEFPLDTDIFKEVCRRIGIFNAAGKPNDKYMAFVAKHVEWAMKQETEGFRSEINTKEKARDFIRQLLGDN